MIENLNKKCIDKGTVLAPEDGVVVGWDLAYGESSSVMVEILNGKVVSSQPVIGYTLPRGKKP